MNPSSVPESATPTDLPPESRRRIGKLLTRDEMRTLNERSDLMGAAAVAFTWVVIIATLTLLAWAARLPWYLALPCYAVGIVVLAGRQLALAILTHEAAHKSLFKTAWLNDAVGESLCARPIGIHLVKYRAHHFVHHRRTNQPDDPDLSLITPFPTSRPSLVRKLARDVLGLTGLKYLLGRVLMDAEVMHWTVANDVVWLPRNGRRWWSYPLVWAKNATGMLIANALLFAAMWASGHPWLYAVWIGAYITPFPLFLRVRSLAEHACTSFSADMFANTRTTRAGILARATVAPIRVNYHVEHHAMPSVPYFRLPLLHRMLRERGAVTEPKGYMHVLQLVSSEQRNPY